MSQPATKQNDDLNSPLTTSEKRQRTATAAKDLHPQPATSAKRRKTATAAKELHSQPTMSGKRQRTATTAKELHSQPTTSVKRRRTASTAQVLHSQPTTSVTAGTALSSDLALAFSTRSITSTHAPPGKSADRTLRINLFSNSVTETQLVEWLEGLACDEPDGHSSPNESNILKLTLYPYRTWQVATVTFCSVPSIFALCAPGRGQEARVKIGETEAIDISVDCDFWGLTPLYTAQVPSVEYAIFLLFLKFLTKNLHSCVH
jgi:hypothetical protein